MGNHDVDVLSQPEILQHLQNYGQNHALGHYVIQTPLRNDSGHSSDDDSAGCLIADAKNVWVVHDDGQ